MRIGRPKPATPDATDSSRHSASISRISRARLAPSAARTPKSLRRAVNRDADDIKALFLLVKVVDQEHQPDSDSEHQRLVDRIVALRPDNLYVLLDRLKTALRRSDREAIRRIRRDLRFEAWLR